MINWNKCTNQCNNSQRTIFTTVWGFSWIVSRELCYNQSLLISNPITILDLEFSPIKFSVNIQITQRRYKFLITTKSWKSMLRTLITLVCVFVFTCVCVFVCLYLWVIVFMCICCVCLCVCVYVYLCVCVCVFVFMCICVCVCVFVCLYLWVFVFYVCLCVCVFVCVYVWVCVYVGVCV